MFLIPRKRPSLGEKKTTSKCKHKKKERLRETPQNHALRLQTLTNRQTVRHQNKSSEQHQASVQDISTRQAVRHQNETEEQHHTHIQNICTSQSLRHQSETDEQHHTCLEDIQLIKITNCA